VTELPVEALKVGDVLARDVIEGKHNVLLASGTTLKAQHIEILKKRDILTVMVKTEEELRASIPEPAQAPAAAARETDPALHRSVERKIKELDHVFELVKGDPLMGALYASARARIERPLREGEGAAGSERARP